MGDRAGRALEGLLPSPLRWFITRLGAFEFVPAGAGGSQEERQLRVQRTLDRKSVV